MKERFAVSDVVREEDMALARAMMDPVTYEYGGVGQASLISATTHRCPCGSWELSYHLRDLAPVLLSTAAVSVGPRGQAYELS